MFFQERNNMEAARQHATSANREGLDSMVVIYWAVAVGGYPRTVAARETWHHGCM